MNKKNHNYIWKNSCSQVFHLLYLAEVTYTKHNQPILTYFDWFGYLSYLLKKGKNSERPIILYADCYFGPEMFSDYYHCHGSFFFFLLSPVLVYVPNTCHLQNVILYLAKLHANLPELSKWINILLASPGVTTKRMPIYCCSNPVILLSWQVMPLSAQR